MDTNVYEPEIRARLAGPLRLFTTCFRDSTPPPETACAVAAAAAADTDTGNASQAFMTIKDGKSSPDGFPSFEGKIPDVTLN